MKKKYFHNEIILNRGDELNELCLVDSGKAVVVNPLDSKIMILDPDTKCKHKLDKKEGPAEPKLTKVLPQPADYLT